MESLSARFPRAAMMVRFPETKTWQQCRGSACESDGKTIQVLSGPEGGLDPKEEDALISRGFQPWSLGSRILRAETAALKALMVFSQDA